MSRIQYEEVTAATVPANLVWIVPARHGGQIVEVAYSTGVCAGKRVNYDADHGDLWKRATDRSDQSVRYYRRRS